jgi:uncharacterized membrane protein
MNDPKSPFPTPFRHDHPPIRNVNDLIEEKSSPSQRAADWLAEKVGSWGFIIGQSIMLVIWVILNVTGIVFRWDPYPFILMNLVMSLQAAFTAPIIMMSQNRQAERDRVEAHHDYKINLKAEEEVRVILEHLEAQNKVLEALAKSVEELKAVRK